MLELVVVAEPLALGLGGGLLHARLGVEGHERLLDRHLGGAIAFQRVETNEAAADFVDRVTVSLVKHGAPESLEDFLKIRTNLLKLKLDVGDPVVSSDVMIKRSWVKFLLVPIF